ncbi:MAG TPA: acyltransferase [Candidatus Nanoarchaeia archaeon]|nr:acyltransferase [Candidatus Nanoarchaeia archaeon]
MSMIHPTADVSPQAKIGKDTRIWHQAQVREGAKIGENGIIGKNAYIDHDVSIGSNVKIQNNVSIYFGVTIEDGVFVGPHVCFTNDHLPRAINPDGTLKSGGTSTGGDWAVEKTLVKYGASIGANSTVRGGITIGRFALIGAGSVVTTDVADHELVYGNPARPHGFVCKCGRKLVPQDTVLICSACNWQLPRGSPE